MADRLADVSRATVQRPVSTFLTTRLNVVRHVLDAMADSQDKQKEKDDTEAVMKVMRSVTKSLKR